MLLDEPFADLDVDAVMLLRAAINTALARGQRVLVATHLHHELDQDANALHAIQGGVLETITAARFS